MRREIIGIAAALALGVATIATGTAASFGGHGGAGAHFGGGGMGRMGGMGGMGGGARFSGGVHSGFAPHMVHGFSGSGFNRSFAVHDGFHNRFAFHNRFFFRHHHRFFHRRFAFFAFTGDSCWRWRHVWTPFGWHWRRIWVCGY